MVQAVISSSGDVGSYEKLAAIREWQMERSKGQPFNLTTEAQNLRELLIVSGNPGNLERLAAKSIKEIQSLLEMRRGDVFVGFQAGTDYPPHLHHIDSVAQNGFMSPQGLLGNEMITEALMARKTVDIFINYK